MDDLSINATIDTIDSIIENGVNLDLMMEIDFFVAFKDEKNAKKFAKIIKENFINVSVEKDNEVPQNTSGIQEWTCYCTKLMFLELKEILDVEKFLIDISKDYNGTYDGFGTYGNLQN